MDSHNKVHVNELLAALNHYTANIKVLSLDCFDTLLWRLTEKPEDVFFAMQQSVAFQAIGLSAMLRSQAETKARQMRWLAQRTTEVTLQDIYRQYLPTLTQDQLAELVHAELIAEKAYCYGFPPIIELIRAAHQRNIKIIIVSDTYLTESQLKSLLAALLPADVLSMVEKIFCSSDYHRGKMHGLFSDVLRVLQEKPEHILHIGDNMAADYVAARTLKLNALHFIQESDYLKNLQRLRSIAANLIDPAVRTTQPAFNPYRAVFAAANAAMNKPDFLIGYYSLGPIMYAFAQFILNEIEKLKQAGKKPKVLFLLRDGYLPSLACEALVGQAIGHRVMLSRFSAFAASFQTKEDINYYLSDILNANRFEDIARQLLLPKKVADPIIHAAQRSANPEEEFVNLIHRKDVLRIIFKKSAEYRTRLKCYLEKNIALQAGDKLVFVDLGYTGTVQRQLSPFFNEMGITVEGRYLIALEAASKETYRAGLLDASHYDNKTLRSLLQFIALFEKLCTSNEKSVINYDEQGNVIHADVGMSEQQQIKLLAIQNEALRFVRDAKKFFQAIPEKFSDTARRAAVLAELARMTYLPTAPELHYLQSFQFDFNLGSQDVRQLFDPKQGLAGLKRRGLFYIDNHSQANRTNYPAELRIAGFELALTFMSQIRFNLDPNLDDMLPRQEFIEARLQRAQQTQAIMLGACATHDGYYAVAVEAGESVILLIGKRYQWIQIESAELINEDAFIKQKEAGNLRNVLDQLVFEGMLQHGGGLFQCLSTTSFIKITPNSSSGQENTIFRLVYRPIVFQNQVVMSTIKID